MQAARPVSEESRIAAAQSYIDALVSHDADAVPFAAGCTRIELGIKNGFSGNHLRRGLNRGLQYRVISDATPDQLSRPAAPGTAALAVAPPDYRIDGDEVHAKYDVLTKAAFAGRRIAGRINETFVIPAQSPSGKAEIQHIRVRFTPFIQS